MIRRLVDLIPRKRRRVEQKDASTSASTKELRMTKELGGYINYTQGMKIGTNDKYELISELGVGVYSSVWLCKDTESAEYNAVKVLRNTPDSEKDANDEIRNLVTVKNAQKEEIIGLENIVSLVDTFTLLTNENVMYPCLVLPVMGPSLRDLLIDSDCRGFGQSMIKSVIKQLLTALVYLHEAAGLVHTDIKPDNILVEASNNYIRELLRWNSDEPKPSVDVGEEMKIKLADFGLAYKEDELLLTSDIQPQAYRAIEVFLKSGSKYSYPVDIWSVGCVTYELATGAILFNPPRIKRLHKNEAHLKEVWEVLGGIPKYVALGGLLSNIFFNTEGNFRRIPQCDIKVWNIEDVLVRTYKWRHEHATLMAECVKALIDPDFEKRVTARSALRLNWLL